MEKEKVFKPSVKYTIVVIGICLFATLSLLCVGWTSNDMTSPIAILVVIIITGIIICLDALDIRARQSLVVTNDRIYTLKQGRFGNSERVDVLLSHINNITIKKPFHGIYGKIQVITGNDIHALVFDRLDNPEGVVEYIYQIKNIQITETEALLNISGGDARMLLNLLEVVADASEKDAIITDKLVLTTAQKKMALYDKSGEQHYDIISAFIKSIRGSDPNAAVYWLARMIDGGEDVKFIARRMVILASEDIGNANPTALVLANNCFDAVHKIGYPESNIILSQCATYLASSPKSNAAVVAINEAMESIKKYGDLPVPMPIRNAPTGMMKDLGYGKGYEYSHNYFNNFSTQEYLPDKISGTKFYNPGNNAREEELRKFLRNLWKEKYHY